MTTFPFPFRFRLFWTVFRLSLLLVTLELLLPAEAVSVQLPQVLRPRLAVDELPTVEVPNPLSSNPLAPSEITRGKLAADSSDTVKRARVRAASSPRPPRLRQLLNDVQTLYAQKHIEDKNADPRSRKADVFYYDYSTNEAIRVVVDLNRNVVQETHVASGVANQPFFTSTEIKAALQLVFDDPQVGPRLQAAYQHITGQNLNDPSQLIPGAQGGIFFPGSASHTPLEEAAAVCAVDRCMELFLTINERSFIDMSGVVVNLSTGEILSGGVGPTGQTF